MLLMYNTETPNMAKKRIQNLRKELKKLGLSGILISSPTNCFYLTEFQKPNGEFRAIQLLVTQNKIYIFTNSLYINAVEVWKSRHTESPNKSIEILNLSEQPFNTLLKSVCTENSTENLGFEGNNITILEYLKINKALKEAKVNLVVSDRILEDLRKIKDETEVERMERAAQITDTTFKQILSTIKPGITEKDLATEIDYKLRKNSADEPAFETIVASGPNSATPHHKTGSRKIESSDIVLIDFGARYNGYCSDMTRMVFIGKPTNEQREIYTKVLETQENSLESAKLGVTGNSLDYSARNILKKYKLQSYFTHNLGHSLGLEIHESPGIGPGNDEKLENNMIFTIEPGLYFPAKFGIRIEDTILLKDGLATRLTKTDKKLTVI